jgi:hypothetical protein
MFDLREQWFDRRNFSIALFTLTLKWGLVLSKPLAGVLWKDLEKEKTLQFCSHFLSDKKCIGIDHVSVSPSHEAAFSLAESKGYLHAHSQRKHE